jgi:protein phosphatase
MLLTITNTQEPATDLGYLLHKNPARVQSFPLSFGQAHVFYPEASDEQCTAALLLDVDPVGLVRNRRGPSGQGRSLEQYVNDVLDIEDVSGKHIVRTRLHHSVTIREENATPALEVMSRFAADPKWLIYLPPTMSPSETTKEYGLLEHPAEAFAYFLNQGVPKVICEEKHMGSRAVVVVCRDEEAARKRFGIVRDGAGICYTRTGRRFFDDRALEKEFLARIRAAIDRAGMWEEFETDWMCLDCELMPWSAKAQELLRQQYAAVGAASAASLKDAVASLAQASADGRDRA